MANGGQKCECPPWCREGIRKVLRKPRSPRCLPSDSTASFVSFAHAAPCTGFLSLCRRSIDRLPDVHGTRVHNSGKWSKAASSLQKTVLSALDCWGYTCENVNDAGLVPRKNLQHRLSLNVTKHYPKFKGNRTFLPRPTHSARLATPHL